MTTSEREIDELRAEVERLQRRVEELTRAEAAAREVVDLFHQLIDNAPMFIFAKDLAGRYLFVNRVSTLNLGMPAEEIKGKTDAELHPNRIEEYASTDRQVIEAGVPLNFEERVDMADGVHLVYTVKFPLFDAAGKIYGICGVSSDVTAHRRAERENRALQEEMLRVQAAALRALSTPLIPIARGVIAMPLVGDLDGDRIGQVLERLLRGVSESRARVAIVDITGVTTAGADVASGLVQAARAVGLLGAQVVLTGVQPSMAQALASVGEQLAGIVTRGTLESGIEYAMSVAPTP